MGFLYWGKDCQHIGTEDMRQEQALVGKKSTDGNLQSYVHPTEDTIKLVKLNVDFYN